MRTHLLAGSQFGTSGERWIAFAKSSDATESSGEVFGFAGNWRFAASATKSLCSEPT